MESQMGALDSIFESYAGLVMQLKPRMEEVENQALTYHGLVDL